MALKWPRISIVTAVYNGEQYLEETIRSILDQDYPNLEYVIVDDGSTDGTREIIQKYEKRLAWWTSQKNQGMYRSLNTGFAHTTGELMGWLNAADKLHTASLFAIGRTFNAFSEVAWITRHPTRRRSPWDKASGMSTIPESTDMRAILNCGYDSSAMRGFIPRTC
jgi:glycosyltransferase involved in cell wall biosynthesis